jgi:hypothetical protein
MESPDLSPFDALYRAAKGAPCECGDANCPVPVWLPETVTLELCEPDETVLVIRADGYPVATWAKGRK